MNKHAVNNPLLRKQYGIHVIPLYFEQTLKNIGTISFTKIVRMIQFFFTLIYKLISLRPKIIYFTITPTGNAFYRDAFFVAFIKLFAPKILFHLHGKGINDAAANSSFRKWLYKKTFKGAYIISISNKLKEDLNLVYMGEPFVLNNGIEVYKKERKDNNNTPPKIIYLSNLVINKGIKVFLNCLAELNRDGFSFNAQIIGDAADFSIEEAVSFCINNGLTDKVKITGPKLGNEKIDFLFAGDIFVLPSFNEAFPLTILEAMQAGLAIIATNVGGIPDIINDNENGLLIEPNNINELTYKLSILLTDQRLRQFLGRNAKEQFHSRFTIDRFNHGLAEIFEKVNSN